MYKSCITFQRTITAVPVQFYNAKNSKVWLSKQESGLLGHFLLFGSALWNSLLETSLNFIISKLQKPEPYLFIIIKYNHEYCVFQDNPLYSCEKCHAFQCDITRDDLSNTIPENSLDLVTMIFVLSAIRPDKMVSVLKNIYKVTLHNEVATLIFVHFLLWF